MDAILAAIDALQSGVEQKQGQAASPPPQPAPKPPPRPVAPAQPTPRTAPAAEVHRADALHPLQGMFEDGNSLLRAVIAAEVLGPPAALREQSHWKQQPNEPSI